MKDKHRFEEIKSQNKTCFWAGIGSFLLGETKVVRQHSVLSKINILIGHGLTGYSTYNAFRMLDQLDDTEDDVEEATEIIRSEFIFGPIVNRIMLDYSNASEEFKSEFRKKLGIEWLGKYFA